MDGGGGFASALGGLTPVSDARRASAGRATRFLFYFNSILFYYSHFFLTIFFRRRQRERRFTGPRRAGRAVRRGRARGSCPGQLRPNREPQKSVFFLSLSLSKEREREFSCVSRRCVGLRGKQQRTGIRQHRRRSHPGTRRPARRPLEKLPPRDGLLRGEPLHRASMIRARSFPSHIILITLKGQTREHAEYYLRSHPRR